ncbi:unnamed protein product [Lepeophtheirus salmonis]|uniref:(salmon louse) hypothetical protein n=1 Tax=Lepeophtheirus salmonis TaxID=72036 RepID=A0A7R8DC49_LEPSM|nr:unnamed protein product [Lepeophtheirus salmonis]CAF3039871.1 unnamed protein product [Lepeophtheirus salmonis]
MEGSRDHHNPTKVYQYNKPSLLWSIFWISECVNGPDKYCSSLLNSLFLATSIFRIICLHDAVRSLRDGDLIGLFIGVGNLVILCWGTFVLFGYGKFEKWNLEKSDPYYCDHAPVVIALANLIAAWVLIPLFVFVELYKLFRACTMRMSKSNNNPVQKRQSRIQPNGFHNASLKLNGIV